MLVARKVLSLTKSLAGTNGFQLRTSAISGPARVKVPAAVRTNNFLNADQSTYKFNCLVNQFSFLSLDCHKMSNFKYDFVLQEKAFLGLLIVGGVTFFPAWVLTHIAEYRGGAADE